MSSGWKNPFMKEMQAFENDGIDKEDTSKHIELFSAPIDGKKIKPNYTKDLRYSSKYVLI